MAEIRQIGVNMRRGKKLNGEKIFSIVITCAIVLTLAIGVISVIKNSQKNSGNPENIVDLNETKDNNLALNNDDSLVQENKTEIATEKATLNNGEDKTIAVKPEETKVAVVEAPTASAKYSFSENDTLKWPVKGDLIIKYSIEHGVFFKTLNEYKINPAIVIAAQVGTDVVAAASGVVESVTTNEETGLTLVINIGNEYVTTYGQLENVTLKKGSTIVAGQKIGTVANQTKYYLSEGSNVYFKLTKATDPVDPTIYLVEE